MQLDTLLRRARRRPIVEPGPTTQHIALDHTAIEQLLPHRAPMLLVDRVEAVDLVEATIHAQRRIDPEDPVLAGHFPEYPVYPGALLVEAMGQACLCLQQLLALGRVELHEGDSPRALRLIKVHHATFLEEVRPGDDITLLGRRLEDDGTLATCAGQALRNGVVCASAILDVYFPEAAE